MLDADTQDNMLNALEDVSSEYVDYYDQPSDDFIDEIIYLCFSDGYGGIETMDFDDVCAAIHVKRITLDKEFDHFTQKFKDYFKQLKEELENEN